MKASCVALLEEGKLQVKTNDDIMGRGTPHSTLAGWPT